VCGIVIGRSDPAGVAQARRRRRSSFLSTRPSTLDRSFGRLRHSRSRDLVQGPALWMWHIRMGFATITNG